MNIIHTTLEFINNSTILSLLSMITICLLIWGTYRIFLDLLDSIQVYFRELGEKIHLQNLKAAEKQPIERLPMTERVELTERVLDLISNTISLEIAEWLAKDINLNNPVDIAYLDEVYKSIGEKVYNAFSSDVFTDPNLLYTATYLQTLIVKSTIQAITNAAIAHNANIITKKTAEE